jgi:hypothetical protein
MWSRLEAFERFWILRDVAQDTLGMILIVSRLRFDGCNEDMNGGARGFWKHAGRACLGLVQLCKTSRVMFNNVSQNKHFHLDTCDDV